MLKKSLVVITIMISSLVVFGAPSLADDHSDLEEKVQYLSDHVYSLEDTVKELSFQIQQTQSMNTIIKELSYQLKEAESGIRDLEGVYKKVDNLYPQILNLEGTVQGLAASFGEKFSVLQGRVFDLETSVQGLDARMKSVEGNVRELLKLQSKVEKLDDRVVALEEFKDYLSNLPSGSPEDMAKLMNAIETMRVETQGEISMINDRVAAIEANVGALPVDEMQEQITRSRNRIASLEVSKADAGEVDALNAEIARLENELVTEIENAKLADQQNMILASLGLAVGAVALASAFGVF